MPISLHHFCRMLSEAHFSAQAHSLRYTVPQGSLAAWIQLKAGPVVLTSDLNGVRRQIHEAHRCAALRLGVSEQDVAEMEELLAELTQLLMGIAIMQVRPRLLIAPH